MRKKRWIAPVWGMLAAAAFGQSASAQAPGSPLDGPFPPAGPPAGPPVAPPPGAYPAHPTYTPIAPDAASPAGFPPRMEAWPTISPYDHAVDTTYNDRGIWFREMLNHERKYRVDVDFISGRFRQPGNAIVGHDIVRGRRDVFGEEEVAGVDTLPPPQVFIGAKQFFLRESRGRYYPEPFGEDVPAVFGLPPRPAATLLETFFGTIDGTGSNGFPIDLTYPDNVTGLAPAVNLDGSVNLEDAADDDDDDEISGTNLFVVTGGVLAEDAAPRLGGYDDVIHQRKENPSSPGLRIVFGLEDEDESGFDWTGWWLNDEAQVFRRGLDDPRRLRANGVVLFDLGEFPLEDDTLDLVEVLDYNQLFEIKHEAEAASTDLAFYHTPMVDYGWLRLRPLYGARYSYIREQFNFTGRDTGQFVVYDQTGRAHIVSDTEFAFDDPEILYSLNPYETSVTSKVQSHLYGPQIGLDLHVGGEYFMINSVAKTGIVANTEKLALGAYGFGTREAIEGVRTFFSDSKTHTHVSPFLEFNANADINVFPIIPVVNRWAFL
ncbi:MAG TPA: hypothetical protein VF170_07805, partial [Planctomycetaceae bacterium]